MLKCLNKNGFIIQSLLSSLASSYKEIDPLITIVQFGSSTFSKNTNDIDILLLSNHSFCEGFHKKLLDLRTNLLQGIPNYGFGINSKVFTEQTLKIIGQAPFQNLTICPKFIIGPYRKNHDLFQPNLFLHFKGPITKLEFILFCNIFPFHAKSILSSSQIVIGEFNRDFFDQAISINANDYAQFNNGLRQRVMASNEVSDIKKCTRKLLMNYFIFLDYSKNNLETASSRLPEISDYENSNDIQSLKRKFELIYRKALKLI